MAKLSKLFWMFISISLIVIYTSSAIYIDHDFNVKEKNIYNQIVDLTNKKKDLIKQKKSLLQLQDDLLSNLAIEQNTAKKRELALKIEELNKQAELQRIADQKILQEQQAKLDLQRREAEIRAKMQQRRRSRAS